MDNINDFVPKMMNKKKKKRKIVRKILYFLILVIILKNCATIKPPQLEQKKGINHLSFWLDKMENPDRLILSRSQISKLNLKINNNKFMGRPLSEKSIKKGYIVKRMILSDLKWMYRLKKYDINNNRIYNKKLKSKILPLLALYRIPKRVKTRFCLVIKPTHLRSFPTDLLIMTKPDDTPFDTLQKSFLDIGEPLALYHTSKDKKWGFVLSAHSHGWVRLKHIAWTYNKGIVKKYHNPSNLVVALDWEVPIYSDENLSSVSSVMHMGTTIPLISKNATNLIVELPCRTSKGKLQFQKAYIKNSNAISLKYLELTPGNIAKQSFKMLGQPYSWGGKNFNTDCSYFIKVVFQAMGIYLPRNSYAQIKSLKNFRIYQKNKDKILNSANPFQTLLYYSDPGHIMLYIGKIKSQHYVIHNKWSYKTLVGKKEKEIYLKKTLISSLTLGENSKKGSLFKKISRVGVLY